MFTISNIGIFLIIGATVLAMLPTCPFQSVINFTLNNQVLKAINFFIPVSEMISITELWLSAILVFYVISMLLRWLKVVQ